jgi:hypothetical protein
MYIEDNNEQQTSMTRRRGARSRKRIAELKRQIREVAGPVAFGGGDCPPEIEELFLEQVLAFERQAVVPISTASCTPVCTCHLQTSCPTWR